MAFKLVRVFPTAEARAEGFGTDEAGDAAGHVHDARAGEVDDAADKVIGVEGGEEASRVPDPVDDDRVDEAGDEERVDEVGAKLAALSDSTGDDGRRGSGKGEREEEGDPAANRVC